VDDLLKSTSFDILTVVDMNVAMNSASSEPVACCAPLAAAALSDAEAAATAELFKALGEPARVRIVNVLATSAAPVPRRCACAT
jgi:hypothetical protein